LNFYQNFQFYTFTLRYLSSERITNTILEIKIKIIITNHNKNHKTKANKYN